MHQISKPITVEYRFSKLLQGLQGCFFLQFVAPCISLSCAPNLSTSHNTSSLCGCPNLRIMSQHKNPSGSKTLSLEKGKNLTKEIGRRNEHRNTHTTLANKVFNNITEQPRLHQDAVRWQSSFSISVMLLLKYCQSILSYSNSHHQIGQKICF